MIKQFIKYRNRKIYFKSESRYATVKEVAEMVRCGDTIQVTCAVTRNDVTDAVLAQAVLQKGITRQTAINLLREVQ